MFKCNFKAYEGNEKYIFISYAHKDSDMVYPIIERLNAEGYRVWYDDGIAPGSEWPENIADHLARCETFLFFASPNSVSSDNCKREVNFALAHKKNFFTISLVPTQFSLGLELQISTQQNILFYEYKDIVKFYDTLFFASSLAECKRPEENNLVMDPPLPVNANVNVNPNPVPVNTVNAALKNPEKKSEKGLIIGCIAGAAVLLVALCVGYFVLNSKVKFGEYTEYERNENYAYFSNENIDSEFVKKLSKMKNIEYLSFTNCSFSDNADLNELSCLSKVTSLTIVNCDLKDYSFLSKMTAISYVELENASLSNVDQISNEELTHVSLKNMSDVSLNFFSGCKNLSSLELKDCSLKTDSIGPLPSNLSRLTLSGCGLSDTTFLEGSKFDYLLYLDLSNNDISDVCFISGVYDTLYHLDLSNNPIDVASLAVIQNCVELEYLDLSSVPLQDLSIVGYMHSLEYLNLSGCGITDLSNGSLQAKKLEKLILANNNFTSLQPLEDIQNSVDSLEIIDVSHNPITSLEGLPEGVMYRSFLAYDTKVEEDEQLFNYLSKCSFENLAINYFDGIEKLDVTYELIVVDCPTDKAGTVEESKCMEKITNYSADYVDSIKNYE